VDEEAIADYERLPVNTVPPSLIERSLAGETEMDAEALAKGFYGERQGYANTADLPPEETFTRAAAGGRVTNDNGATVG